MPDASSAVALTNLKDGVKIERRARLSCVGDSCFQLSSRRHFARLSDVDESSKTQQDDTYIKADIEVEDGSESDSYEAMLTPEAASSDDEERETIQIQGRVSQEVPQPTWQDRRLFAEAIECEDIDTIKAGLVGINVNQKMFNGFTPLATAVIKCQVGTVRFLLERGANVHQRVGGFLPIAHAASRTHGAPQLMQILMDYGATPNAISEPGHYNTLHFAAMHGKVDAVDFLISKGMDMERVTSNGQTPLLLAAEKGHTVVAKVLLCKGAELRHSSSDGRTALAWAACNNHLETVKFLLEEGINVNDRDDTGVSALFAASMLGFSAIVRLLLDQGANVDTASVKLRGLTPLMAAAIAGHSEVVQILINQGADLTVRDGDDNTVIDATLAAGHHDTVCVILRALGSPDYPLGDITISLAMSNSAETTKLLMVSAGIMYPPTDPRHEESGQLSPLARALPQAAHPIKPRALNNMMYAALHEEDVKVVHALSAFNNSNRNKHLLNGDTPLTLAVRRRNIPLIKKLLEWGYDASLTSRLPKGDNYTPLMQALVALREDVSNDNSIVDALIHSGHCKYMTGETARSTPFDYILNHFSRWRISFAIEMTNIMMRSAELSHDTDRSDDGATMLHVAVHHKRYDLVEFLLKTGADINARDEQGCTSFILECQGGSTELLCRLLTDGADPRIKDSDGQNALHAAAGAGKLDVIDFLLSLNLPIDALDKEGYSPFSWAVIHGQETAALHLLSRGAQIPTRIFRRSRTILHTACSQAMSRLAGLLLAYGKFDTNAQDDLSFTPLALACRKGSTNLVTQLLNAGANMEIMNNAGDTPLHVALKAGNEPVVLSLVQCGANIFAQGNGNATPLHLAVKHSLVQSTTLLLEHGADPHVYDVQDRSPLSLCGDPCIATLLLDAGADLNDENPSGWTALHYAVAGEHVDVFRLLMEAGADIRGRTLDDGLGVVDRIGMLGDEKVRGGMLRSVAERGNVRDWRRRHW